MMRIISLLLQILLFNSMLFAEETEVIDYEISYLGIPLLDMQLTWVEDDSTVRVSYDNKTKPFINIIHPVHNIYRVQFMKPDFEPLNWAKTIREGNMHFRLSAYRSEDGSQVSYSNDHTGEFPEGGFTVFSATHYLASSANDASFFPASLKVFIDGEVWEARATRYDYRNPHPDHYVRGDEVLIQADLHYLSGSSLLEENDILTSHIAREGTQFFLWVSKHGVFTKAQFDKFPRAVVLKMKK